MTAKQIYVFGAGGHGKAVADILRVGGHRIVGFVDDSAHRYQRPVLGFPVITLHHLLEKFDSRDAIGIALGIGDNCARQKAAQRSGSNGLEIVTAVHPDAVLSRTAKFGVGTVVMPGAIVNVDAELGLGVIINSGAIVEHDCIVGDYAHISPKAALGGGACIGPFAHVGLGAAVLPGVAIGARSTIGVGAVVVHNIPDGVVAMGVPARIHAKVASKASGSA